MRLHVIRGAQYTTVHCLSPQWLQTHVANFLSAFRNPDENPLATIFSCDISLLFVLLIFLIIPTVILSFHFEVGFSGISTPMKRVKRMAQPKHHPLKTREI